METIKLYQICNQLDIPYRNALRIRVDGTEFSYGTQDYNRMKDVHLVWHEFKVNKDFSTVLIAGTRDRVRVQEKEPRYEKPAPQYSSINI